jgi:N-methylhydantoinase B
MTEATERRVDPITFEVIKYNLDSIADQAAITLFRSAYSAIVRDSLDYSTAVFDGRARMLAQGLTTPMHIGSFPDAMQILMIKYEDRIYPDDVFIANDPYSAGGMHLPDVYIIKPVFFEGERVAFTTTLTHLADIGGITPGSNPVHSTEIYQEGLRIPVLKLYERGEANQTLMEILENNTRLPVKLMGDIRAQIAGCRTAEVAMVGLFERYGAEQLSFYFDELIDYSERVMREELAAVPDGEYEFTDYIDGLGDDPKPLVFQVKVTIDSDEMYVDWTGTAEQVKAGINAPYPFTKAATYLVARLLVRRDVPNSEGYFRPLHTYAPEGSILNPREPAGCATRGITGMRAVDALLGALAAAVPDRIPACMGGDNYWPTFGGYEDGKPFVHVESVMGAWGGRPIRDGISGGPHPGGNQPNQPVEMVEARHPLEITEYSIQRDATGAGRWRGGNGLVREYRLRAEEAVLTIRTARRTALPYGLQGGKPGTPAYNIVNPGPHERILPTLPMEAVHLERDDVLRIELAGAGGWGDPLEREPWRVLDDVLDDKISVEHARDEYGVALDPGSLEVDDAATEALRREMRKRSR